MVSREDLIKIVEIFKNDGIDQRTGKKLTSKAVYDFFDIVNEAAGYENAIDIVFSPEKVGLSKDAKANEIVDFILDSRID